MGFTAATVVFLLLWFLVGGIRKPVQLLSVTLIGTWSCSTSSSSWH